MRNGPSKYAPENNTFLFMPLFRKFNITHNFDLQWMNDIAYSLVIIEKKYNLNSDACRTLKNAEIKLLK